MFLLKPKIHRVHDKVEH